MKRVFFLIYQFLIYIPVGILLTILGAILSIFLCLFFESKVSTYYLRYCWARPMIYLLFCRVKVTGKENLDKSKSAIYISNHQGVYDIFLLYGWLHVDFRWIMKKEIMKIPLIGYSCKKVGHIPIDRKNRRSAMRSIMEAKQRLIDGASVVFFPEGTRSLNGEVKSFKKGAFHLAKDLNLPIVPLTINGIYKIMSKGSLFLNPFQNLELVIHPSISSEDVKNKEEPELCEFGYRAIISSLD